MASVRRHPVSNRWQVRYRDPDGRQRSKSFARKVDADRFTSTVEADIARGNYLDPQAGKTTVDEMADRWLATRSHLAQATRDKDESILRSLVRPEFGPRPVVSIRPSEVGAWAASMNRAPFTVGRAVRVLFGVLELARRDRAIASNPATSVSVPRQVAERPGRYLTDNEVAALTTAAYEVDPDTAAMVVLMASAGLRIGEAVGLKREDVDLAGGVVRVRRSRSRKEGDRPLKGRHATEERVVPLAASAVRALSKHLARPVANLDRYVFHSPRGRQLVDSNWRRRVWRRIVEKAGVDAKPHDLRHTVASRLIDVDRWAPSEVQRLMGHRDPRTTLAIYVHLRGDNLPRPSSAVDSMWTGTGQN